MLVLAQPIIRTFIYALRDSENLLVLVLLGKKKKKTPRFLLYFFYNFHYTINYIIIGENIPFENNYTSNFFPFVSFNFNHKYAEKRNFPYSTCY